LIFGQSDCVSGRWWQDVKLELACGAYIAALALALLVVHEGALSTAALVPALYFPLIAPAYWRAHHAV
jgi:hypothetical protein